jgi:hypothetical protein
VVLPFTGYFPCGVVGTIYLFDDQRSGFILPMYHCAFSSTDGSELAFQLGFFSSTSLNPILVLKYPKTEQNDRTFAPI